MLQKIVYICTGMCFMAVALFMSCDSNKKSTAVIPPSNDLRQIGEGINRHKESLQKTTNEIRENATEGSKKTPEKVKPVLDPFWNNIIVSAGVQDEIVKGLEVEKQRADKATTNATEFEKLYSDEKKARLKAEEVSNKAVKEQYRAYSGIFFFGMIGCIIAGIFSPVGKKAFTYASIACGIGCGVALFIVQSLAYIQFVVGAALAMLLILVIWRCWKNMKDENLLNKGAKELVATVEAQKPMMTVAGRKKFFGDGPIPGLITSIQSKETRDLVKSIRNKFDNLAPSVPATVAIDYNGDGLIDERDVEYAKAHGLFKEETASSSSASQPNSISTANSDNVSSSKKKFSGLRTRRIGGPVRAPVIFD
jgi:membrane protein implicated in regulation of membrane protease activity